MPLTWMAWLLAVLSGCSLVVGACGTDPRDPAGDGGTAGADAAPLAGTVTVTVLDDGEPAPQALVLVHDAAGHLVESHRTGGQGRLTAGIPSGGQVSAVWPSEIDPYSTISIQTVTAVEPGDALTFDRVGFALEPPPAAASLTIESGGAPPATFYEVHLGCAVTSVPALPAVLEVPEGCGGADDAIDVVLVAIEVSGGRILIHETVGHAAARISLTGPEIAYTPTAWHDAWDTIPLSVEAPVNPYVDWQLRADGFGYQAPRTDGGVGVWRDFTADGARASGLLDSDDGYALAERSYDGLPAEVTLAEADFLPDPVDQFDLALRDGRAVVAWGTSAANLAAADAMYASITWEGPGVADGRTRWEIVAPREAAEITLPVLPDDLAAIVLPIDVDTPDFRVEVLDGSWMDSYAEMKANRMVGGLWATRLLDLPPGDALLRRTGNGPLFP